MTRPFTRTTGPATRTLAGAMARGAALLIVAAALPAGDAVAQPIGTFRWQQQPYCNVLTLNVVQAGGVYRLDGYDDQCGAATRAAVTGLATPNPNGTIGLGLLVVTTPGGLPLHIDAGIQLSTVSGTWRDSTGATGAWAFVPGGGSGGAPRPVPRPSFPAGLSVGGGIVTNLAAPVAPTDAANKAYVDASIEAAAAPLTVTAYAAAISSGNPSLVNGGCYTMDPGAVSALRLDLRLPIGTSLRGLRLKYVDASTAVLNFRVRAVDFVDGGVIQDGIVAVAATAGSSPEAQVLNLTTTSLPPVGDTRTYYLEVVGGAHTGTLQFCGAAIRYALP